ncbi:single-stranded DNA-binding protein 4 [Rhincodon typus]|uniref:single-stranded DNA-binding protein 4 n=1 Tax=Rhincodon typus TaxID=259920 RepID=UPI00202F4C61|nr:single-stranded DNA-binding protein 4 [Rhincodon typus]
MQLQETIMKTLYDLLISGSKPLSNAVTAGIVLLSILGVHQCAIPPIQAGFLASHAGTFDRDWGHGAGFRGQGSGAGYSDCGLGVPPGSQPPGPTQTPPHNPSNPIMGPHTQPFMSPRYPGNARSSLRMSAQPPAGVPGSQPLLPNTLEPTRQEGPLGVSGPIQRMSAPRGLTSLGPQSYGGAMLPPPNSLGGHGMLGMNLAPGGGGGRSWPNPVNTSSIPYSSSSPGSYVGAPSSGLPGTSIIPSPADSTNSSENMYTMIAPLGAAGSRSSFQMGPGAEGSLAGMAGMEPHHMNGTLGTADMDGLSKNSPNNMTGMSNPPETPRDDGELAGNFLNPFQNESYSPRMTMSV